MHKQAALVIGASRGIGLAVVRHFSAQDEGMVATWNTTRPASGETNITWLQTDISRRDSLMYLGSACTGRCFDFILVNAGICGPAHQDPDFIENEETEAFLQLMRWRLSNPMIAPQELSASDDITATGAATSLSITPGELWNGK